ncbi:MAG: mechanosensitive ion channel [Desulfobacterales bacterium]
MTFFKELQCWLERLPIGDNHAAAITAIIAVSVVSTLAVVAFMISRRIANRTIPRVFQFTGHRWGQVLVEHNVFRHAALLVPALVALLFIPVVLEAYPKITTAAMRVLSIYLIGSSLITLDALINGLHAIYNQFNVSKEIPLSSLAQVVKIVLYFVAFILLLAVLFDRTPLYLFSGLGAMTAVLMLVFKDPILGFVAGIQLISNRMLKQGDWIEMPKYGADGDVLEITLATVKVQNWDRTITTIPTYALISDSFRNWRGMQESGGRRIMRSIHIDMRTIRFCTSRMLERFSKIRYIADYIDRKHREIDAHNAALGAAARDGANRRRLTNIGTFRAYVDSYLRNHPMINAQMIVMVRQLEPTDHGLPLQVYAFCRDKAWVNYEAVQSDVFDHLLAILPEFDLRIFQNPSGHDMTLLGERFAGARTD